MSNGHKLSHTQQTISAFVSAHVRGLLEYIHFPFPFLSNAAVIDPFLRISGAILFHTSLSSAALEHAASASFPQQLATCLRMLPVNRASPVSRYRHIVVLQFFEP